MNPLYARREPVWFPVTNINPVQDFPRIFTVVYYEDPACQTFLARAGHGKKPSRSQKRTKLGGIPRSLSWVDDIVPNSHRLILKDDAHHKNQVLYFDDPHDAAVAWSKQARGTFMWLFIDGYLAQCGHLPSPSAVAEFVGNLQPV